MKHALTQIIPLAIVCSVLFGYQYLSAEWTEPMQTPPNGNIDAPVNTGSTAQVKNGALSVDALAVFGDMMVDGGGTLVVSNVCNADRSSCGTVEEFLAGGDSETPNYLVNGQHTETQCTDIGGTVVTVGEDTFCRFSGASCPAGWARYENWRTTVNRSCGPSSYVRCNSSCTAQGTSWSSHSPRTCNYVTGTRYDGDSQCHNRQTHTCSAATSENGCY